MLTPLGLPTASAGHHSKRQTNLCKSFCKCSNRKQQDQCLKVCNACGKDPSRLGGSCGNYFCCAAGQTSCGNYCADLGIDPYNCGTCRYACEPPGPFEYGACINGRCEYTCAEGAVDCGGYVATLLLAAQSLGIAAVPQAAVAMTATALRKELNISDERDIVCAVSFGYADESHPANTCRTDRAELDDVVRWVED